jgi:hypothetical protein
MKSSTFDVFIGEPGPDGDGGGARLPGELRQEEVMVHNPEWKWVYISLLAAGFFLVLAVFASTSMDCFSGGCAITFVSGFLVVCGVATALLFFTRAREMDAIIRGTNLLASWTYPEEEMRQSAEREYRDYREVNRGLLFVVGGFILIAMVLMAIFGGEAGLLTAGVLLVVFVLCAIASVAAPWLERRRAIASPSATLITDTGLVYEGAVHPFSSFLLRMDGIRFEEEAGEHPPLLVFSFVQIVGLFILRPYEVAVPVPRGEEERAREIAARLGGTGAGDEDVVPGDRGGYCEQCGAPLVPGKRYCRSCGARTGGD